MIISFTKHNALLIKKYFIKHVNIFQFFTFFVKNTICILFNGIISTYINTLKWKIHIKRISMIFLMQFIYFFTRGSNKFNLLLYIIYYYRHSVTTTKDSNYYYTFLYRTMFFFFGKKDIPIIVFIFNFKSYSTIHINTGFEIEKSPLYNINTLLSGVLYNSHVYLPFWLPIT